MRPSLKTGSDVSYNVLSKHLSRKRSDAEIHRNSSNILSNLAYFEVILILLVFKKNKGGHNFGAKFDIFQLVLVAMEKHPLYGKKKKKKVPCPNPLFEQWLKEWRDSAAEKNMKSQYTYGKALKTLQKFPLKLESGKDCKILENFGDKICKMLDDKLAEHIAMYGTTEPVGQSGVDSSDEDSLEPEVKRTAVPRSHLVTGGRPHELSDSETESAQPSKKRQKSGRKSGEYVPAYRSGPYALIVTLYRDIQDPNSRGYMTKEELISCAQPLADKSFSLPDPGCRYTAWSSMGSLINKGLVVKERSPARYNLTDAGVLLAQRIEAVQATGEHLNANGSVQFQSMDTPPGLAPPSILPNMPSSATGTVSMDEALKKRSLPRMPWDDDDDAEDYSGLINEGSYTDAHFVSSRLQYCYVSDEGTEETNKDRAAVTIDGVLGVGFLVKCSYSALLQSGLKFKLEPTRPVVGDWAYAYLSNTDTADVVAMAPKQTTDLQPTSVSEPISAMPVKSKEPKQPKPSKSKINNSTSPQLLPLVKSSVLETMKSPPKSSGSMDTNVVFIDSEESSLDSLPPLPKSKHTFQARKNQQNLVKKPVENGYSSRSCDAVSIFDRLKTGSASLSVDSQASCSQNSIKSLSSIGSDATDQTPLFVLRPGEFDIVLCIDNAEFYGSSKGSSKTLFPDLIKNGVECDLRKLHVGDILWVAREKTRLAPGVLGRPAGRELVLNYIIERKRMDDLVSSCIDGRYKEQKFRLKACGLHHPMYLIEEYGSMQHFSLPEATIKQTIANTQVIDGFKVKRTRDSKESVAFLTMFTRYLQSCFRDKTLYSCSIDDLKETKLVTKVDDLEQRLPVFDEFNKGSVKTKALTVREMFGKQLIQLHGMSADKARAVINLYPTPSHLYKAYEKCATEKEKENLLSTLKCGKALRNLGSQQSRQIYQLYNTRSALK
ncbi:crossover junction endonuclease MUS81-like isoform X3 [Dreissena polymorpha]|uniref:crossover junction endonuclease MUS81-like isoform X2 n=1 Tax=Dreissena polymorpha TaxID=45954 RepID=UPI0022648CFD|nr:crossover junction endonuclease MUS81-like isoform X2 [Dreissena polymorpha]XP_052251236.1 crossover junction endonuclease MUS81-like isoform X3 [Dreissena polymorpha]